MSNDPELLKKLIDNDDGDVDGGVDSFEDVELQKKNDKKSPLVVVTAVVKTVSPNPVKKKGLSRGGTGRKNGCPCWCKCIGWTMLVLSLLFISVLGCAYLWLNGFLKEAVEQFTIETPSPQKFDIIEMSDSELNVVADRVMLFVDELAVGTNTASSPLVLTQDEINGFIGHSDYLRGNMMVSFHDNLIEEDFSLPMDVLGYGGRYFVGKDYVKLLDNNNDSEQEQDGTVSTNNSSKDTIEMKMTTAATHEDWFDGPLFFAQIQYLITKNKEDEGRTLLSLFLEKGSFFGQNAPQEIVDGHLDLLESLYDADDDDVENILNVISGIESVSIEEGRIIVKARHYGNK